MSSECCIWSSNFLSSLEGKTWSDRIINELRDVVLYPMLPTGTEITWQRSLYFCPTVWFKKPRISCLYSGRSVWRILHPAGGSSRSRDAAGRLLLRQFSILTDQYTHQTHTLAYKFSRLAFWSWIYCFIIMTRRFKELCIDIKTVFLPADGRVESCSAADLPLQRIRVVKISGKVTIAGNSRGNSRPDSEQATDCQNALSILAMVFEELQNQEQDKSVWFKSYREWLKQVWEFCPLSL